MNSNRTALIASALLAAATPSAQAQNARVGSAVAAIFSGDCATGERLVNEGVQARDPHMLNFAGVIYEEGYCGSPDWERAAEFYERAHRARAPIALQRLISLLATGRRDVAAALWWAQQLPLELPGDCRTPSELREPVEAFVEHLKNWGTERLLACNYAAGVAAAVDAGMQKQLAPAGRRAGSEVDMRFLPQQKRIEWRIRDNGASTWSSVEAASADASDHGPALTISRRIGSEALQRFEAPVRWPAGASWQIGARYALWVNAETGDAGRGGPQVKREIEIVR